MISVIIATYMREKALALCLEALRLQTFQDFEVIVVDDGGDDDSQRVFEQSEVSGRYLWHPHDGFGLSRSRNSGARRANGDIFHFIDSDILLCPTALDMAFGLYTENRDRAIGGYYKYLPGMVINKRDVAEWNRLWNMDLPRVDVQQGATPVGEDVRDAWRRGRADMWQESVDVFEYEHDVLWSPFCLLGANMVIPRHIFNAVGGFDQNINTYGGEDAEMSLAIISHGYGISYSRRVAGAHMAHPKYPGVTIKDEMDKRVYIATRYPEFLNPDGTPKEEIWGKDQSHRRTT